MPIPLAPAQTILPAQARLGEGALWDSARQCLFWVDIEGCALHLFDPATGHDRALPTPARISTVVPFAGAEVLVALQTGLHKMHLETGRLTLLINPHYRARHPLQRRQVRPGRPLLGGHPRFGPKARRGRPLLPTTPTGACAWCSTTSPTPTVMAWSADARTMYYIDTPDPAPCKPLTTSKPAAALPMAACWCKPARGRRRFPDGMTLDAEGNLWVALWGGGLRELLPRHHRRRCCTRCPCPRPVHLVLRLRRAGVENPVYHHGPRGAECGGGGGVPVEWQLVCGATGGGGGGRQCLSARVGAGGTTNSAKRFVVPLNC